MAENQSRLAIPPALKIRVLNTDAAPSRATANANHLAQRKIDNAMLPLGDNTSNSVSAKANMPIVEPTGARNRPKTD